MKKLMIAAAIVCAAAMSQAATYQWNASVSELSPLYKMDGETLHTGVGYIFSADTIGQEALWNAIFTDGTALSALASTYGATEVSLSSGTFGTTTFYTDQDLGDPQSFMLIAQDGNAFFFDDPEMFDASTLPGGKDITMQVGWSQGGAYVYDAKTDGYQGWGGWYYTANIPEPTSGLLLLIGVAGLALRRRRA